MLLWQEKPLFRMSVSFFLFQEQEEQHAQIPTAVLLLVLRLHLISMKKVAPGCSAMGCEN